MIIIPVPNLVSKYYKAPFINNGDIYIYDSNYSMCAMIDVMDFKGMKAKINTLNCIIGFLNNTSTLPLNQYPTKPFTLTNGEIKQDGKVILIIRGWGRLSHITEDKPELIQDTFAKYVLDVLNNTVV